MNCIFCKIVAGEVPSYKVCENEGAMAFMDIHPISLGQVVVVPKEHHSDIVDLPENRVETLFSAVKEATNRLSVALGAENFTIGINHGKMLGDPDIDHMHVLVIPRFEGDGGGDIHSIVNNPPTEKIEDTHKKILESNK